MEAKLSALRTRHKREVPFFTGRAAGPCRRVQWWAFISARAVRIRRQWVPGGPTQSARVIGARVASVAAAVWDPCSVSPRVSLVSFPCRPRVTAYEYDTR